MVADPMPTTEQPPLRVIVEGSAAAPFIYFDGITALGHFGGIVQFELAAQTLVLASPGTKTQVVAVAHLRCTLAGLAALKGAIQKIETMLAPAEGKAN